MLWFLMRYFKGRVRRVTVIWQRHTSVFTTRSGKIKADSSMCQYDYTYICTSTKDISLCSNSRQFWCQGFL